MPELRNIFIIHNHESLGNGKAFPIAEAFIFISNGFSETVYSTPCIIFFRMPVRQNRMTAATALMMAKSMKKSNRSAT